MNHRLNSVLLLLVLGMMVFAAALLHTDLKQLNRQMARLGEQLAGRDPVVVRQPAPPPKLPEQPEPAPVPRQVVEVADDEPPPAAPNSAVASIAPDDPNEAASPASPIAPQPRPAPSGPRAWDTFGPTVQRIIDEVFDRRFDAVSDRFDDDMRAALPGDRLAAALGPILNRAGDMQRITDRRDAPVRLPPRLHAYEIDVATTHGKLTFTITLDDQQRLAGLYVK